MSKDVAYARNTESGCNSINNARYNWCIIFLQEPDSLPTAQTCFFQLRLPSYTSSDKLADKLRYAINNCRSIDLDNYMLIRNTAEEERDHEDDF